MNTRQTRLQARLRRGRIALCVGAGVTALAVPLALAETNGPGWQRLISVEQTPMTWLQSVVLVLVAAGAALLLVTTGDRRWMVLTAGFGVLALDEKFTLHEWIRDPALVPPDVTLAVLPWMDPENLLILVVGVVGLGLLPWVARGFAGDRAATVALVLGTLLAVAAIGADAVDPARWSVTAEQWEQTLEECGELAAGLALATAVWLRVLGVVAAIAGAPAPVGAAGPGTAPGTSPDGSPEPERSEAERSEPERSEAERPEIGWAPPDPGRVPTGI